MEGEKELLQGKLGVSLSLKHFFVPKNNHWLKRIFLVFAFILFDYFSTLAFCRLPFQEANPYARTFMETFGIPIGLTLFVVVANLPIHVALSVDSHIVKLPPRIDGVTEVFVDGMFAWFVAGLHFSGGTSWFLYAPEIMRQFFGALLYLMLAFLLINPLQSILRSGTENSA
jgi:hypothetical protein